jgi:hypothetical protein
MEPHVRAHIHFNTTADATEFVKTLNSDGTTNKYVIENFNGDSRVNARSLLGVIYAMTEHDDNMFLVNYSDDGYFPLFVDKYRM